MRCIFDNPIQAKKESHPIYLFYNLVTADSSGKTVKGSRYYKSFFGNQEVLEMTEKANYNTRSEYLSSILFSKR